MNGSNSLKNVINLVNSGKAYPALSLVRQNPETAAVISKLVRPREIRRFDIRDGRSAYELDQSRLQEISHTVKERISDAENMRRLFPDLELAAQILISSILSPKDMVNTKIIYKITETLIPVDLTMKITDIIADHCEKYYNIKQMFPDILRDILFDSGSYIKAIIPESSVDELINGNAMIVTEQLTELFDKDTNKIRSIGILGSPVTPVTTSRVGVESFKGFERLPYQHYEASITIKKEDNSRATLEGFNVDVTDNFNILKLPQLIETNNRNKVKSRIKTVIKKASQVSLETNKNIGSKELETLLYKGTQSNATPFIAVKTQRTTKRKSIGRPLDMKLPSEATIPVHVPGDPKHHIGYFVLIDEEGNPVTKHSTQPFMGTLQSQLNNATSGMASFLLEKARKNLTGDDKMNISIDQAAKIYSDIVESDLIDRLRNGIYGSKADIAKNEDVYRIMLARSLANQYTRLLYIPVELVTYFAYKYYDNGVGKSLLDDLKVVTSLRAILMFARVMALTKNSIALTHVNMTLDPHDPDPQKTIEMSIHEIIKMRQQYLPLGISSPTDLLDWIQRAGFEFSFEGHPGIPQTKFDFETKQMQHTLPDDNLEELLRKQTFMAIGLSPETVDNGFSAEFATTVVSNNILLSKRVLQIQEQFTPQATDYVRKLITNDAIIRKEIFDALLENKGAVEKILSDEEKAKFHENETLFLEELIDMLIGYLVIDLPKPDITTLENQSQAYEHYSESLDKAIEAWVSSEFITDNIAGDISGTIDTIKAVLKAYFLRRWQSENGFMSELNDIVSTNDDGDPAVDLFETMKAHIAGLMRGSAKFIESLKPMKDAANTDLERLNATGDETTSSSNYDSNDNTGDGGGEVGGDLDFNDMLGGDETTTTETTGDETTNAATGDETGEEKKDEKEEKPSSDDSAT